jgi:hypothetical protein
MKIKSHNLFLSIISIFMILNSIPAAIQYLPSIAYEAVSEKSPSGFEYKHEKMMISPSSRAPSCEAGSSLGSQVPGSQLDGPTFGVDISVPIEPPAKNDTKEQHKISKRRQRR